MGHNLNRALLELAQSLRRLRDDRYVGVMQGDTHAGRGEEDNSALVVSWIGETPASAGHFVAIITLSWIVSRAGRLNVSPTVNGQTHGSLVIDVPLGYSSHVMHYLYDLPLSTGLAPSVSIAITKLDTMEIMLNSALVSVDRVHNV